MYRIIEPKDLKRKSTKNLSKSNNQTNLKEVKFLIQDKLNIQEIKKPTQSILDKNKGIVNYIGKNTIINQNQQEDNISFVSKEDKELKVNQIPELKVNQIPELKVNQIPELKVNQTPELKVNQTLELKVNQTPELKHKVNAKDFVNQNKQLNNITMNKKEVIDNNKKLKNFQEYSNKKPQNLNKEDIIPKISEDSITMKKKIEILKSNNKLKTNKPLDKDFSIITELSNLNITEISNLNMAKDISKILKDPISIRADPGIEKLKIQNSFLLDFKKKMKEDQELYYKQLQSKKLLKV